MKIAISLLNFRPGKIGGAETYIRNLISVLPVIKGDDEITLLMGRDIAREMATDGLQCYVVDKSDAAIARARFLEAATPYKARFAEKILEELSPDVAFFPQQSFFPKHFDCPAVVTVLDLQHLVYPQNFSIAHRIFRAMIYSYSAVHAKKIIAISQFTKRTLTQRCGILPDKITAIPLGINPIDIDPIEPYDNITGRYLYCPAATFPHKGHRVLFETFARLRRKVAFDYKLVLTGWQTPYWNRLQKQARALGINDDVIHLGFLPYAEVLRVFKGAEAILFPTQYEGFGIPVCEASQFAKKVICSRLEVFDEIGVPSEFQIDFSDAEQLLEALNLPGITHLASQPLTWRQVGEQTIDVIRQVGRAGKPESQAGRIL